MLKYNLYADISLIPGAGKGLFTKEFIPKKAVVIFPNDRHQLLSWEELSACPPGSMEHESSIRWFERTHTIDLDWSMECHLNHSFTPNCIWHLGFVFATCDLPAGSELTIDYRTLTDEHFELGFNDAITGEPIHGWSWDQKMVETSSQLVKLFSK